MSERIGKGDAVQHKATGEVGVVIGTSRNRLQVQTKPGNTVIWYTANVRPV